MDIQNYWIGFGCRKNTSELVIREGINYLLGKYGIEIQRVLGIATIDRKLQEPNLIKYCNDHNLQLIGFDELTLSMVKVPNPSANVNNLVNTHSVAESAALLAANNDVLVVPKQTFKLPLKTEIITLAIAQSKITI